MMSWKAFLLEMMKKVGIEGMSHAIKKTPQVTKTNIVDTKDAYKMQCSCPRSYTLNTYDQDPKRRQLE